MEIISWARSRKCMTYYLKCSVCLQDLSSNILRLSGSKLFVNRICSLIAVSHTHMMSSCLVIFLPLHAIWRFDFCLLLANVIPVGGKHCSTTLLMIKNEKINFIRLPGMICSWPSWSHHLHQHRSFGTSRSEQPHLPDKNVPF